MEKLSEFYMYKNAGILKSIGNIAKPAWNVIKRISGNPGSDIRMFKQKLPPMASKYKDMLTKGYGAKSVRGTAAAFKTFKPISKATAVAKRIKEPLPKSVVAKRIAQANKTVPRRMFGVPTAGQGLRGAQEQLLRGYKG